MRTTYKKAVINKDINAVRIALTSELIKDPRISSFKDMLSYAEEHLNDLYEIDNDNFQEKPHCEWNQDYLFDLKNKLLFNFSKQKLMHYETVARELFKEQANSVNQKEQQRNNPHGDIHRGDLKTPPKQHSCKKRKRIKKIAAGIAVLSTTVATVLETADAVADLAQHNSSQD
ncbi:MAG: hypothetical protein J5711_02290 [Bacteroidales bacterium]|nr:hypothetical protein [Bacteroidales bacterium]